MLTSSGIAYWEKDSDRGTRISVFTGARIWAENDRGTIWVSGDVYEESFIYL